MKRLSRFTNAEVRTILKKARRALRHPGLDILIKPSSKPGRILVITPKRVGSAVKRNKIRRQLKAIFYEEKLFDLSCDVIVIIKKEGVTLSFDDLKTLLTNTVRS